MNRNNLKRIAALSLAGIVSAAIFAGCGGKDSDPYASVEYNVDDYVKLGEYKGLNVDEEITIVTDEDIQEAIDSLVESKTTYNEKKDRNAQSGDRVSVSFIRTEEGKSPEDSKTETFEIGSGDMGEDFEDWSLYELKQRTELVQEFDQLADDIVEEALHIASEHTVEERVIYKPTTELVLA